MQASLALQRVRELAVAPASRATGVWPGAAGAPAFKSPRFGYSHAADTGAHAPSPALPSTRLVPSPQGCARRHRRDGRGPLAAQPHAGTSGFCRPHGHLFRRGGPPRLGADGFHAHVRRGVTGLRHGGEPRRRSTSRTRARGQPRAPPSRVLRLVSLQLRRTHPFPRAGDQPGHGAAPHRRHCRHFHDLLLARIVVLVRRRSRGV